LEWKTGWKFEKEANSQTIPDVLALPFVLRLLQTFPEVLQAFLEHLATQRVSFPNPKHRNLENFFLEKLIKN
jgi:hypothetical protein